MAANFDVIVVGAGIAGASVAARLAPFMKVCVLEMEERAGFHSTGRSAAMYEPNYGPPQILALTRAGRGFFDAPPPGFADTPLLAPRATMFFMPDGQEEQAAELLAKAQGLREVSEAEALREYPLLRRGYAKRSFIDAGTADIDVDVLHRGFLRMAKAAGGELGLSAEAKLIHRQNGAWHAGGVSAPVLVNAAGAWADVVALRAGVSPLGLQPKRRSIGVVPPPTGLDIALWPMAGDIGETWYAKPQSGKFLVSSADATPVEPHDAYADDLAVALGIERFQHAAEIEVTRLEASWGGLRNFFPDRTPACGFDRQAEGFFWLAGQGGYGIQSAPGLSLLAMALIRGEAVPEDLLDAGVDAALLAPHRFTKGS